MNKKEVDPIVREVINKSITHIAMEMKAVMRKTAYSSVIYEAQDFSVGIFEKDRMVALADTIAAHMAAFKLLVKVVLEKFPPNKLEQGDVIILNDPHSGGTHTPDVTVIRPVWFGDLLFLPIARGHWSDVGGKVPGSLSGDATEIFQEGLLMPPIKLYKKGELDTDVWDMLMANVRLPDDRAGDLRAQLAVTALAADRLTVLCQKHGEEAVRDSIETLLEATKQYYHSKIGALPDGVYEYEDYSDSDGISPDFRRIKVSAVIEKGNLTFDFTGTDKQSTGPVNCPLATTIAGCFLSVRALFDPKMEWPCNDGAFQCMKVVAPEGTIVNPRRPAPTGGVWEICGTIMSIATAALSRVCPLEVLGAAGNGATPLHYFVGGIHPDTRRFYVWYDDTRGGIGAIHNRDGEDSVCHVAAGDCRDNPVERVEHQFPFICVDYHIRPDSGGAGKFRGGDGVSKAYMCVDPQQHFKIGLTTLWMKAKLSDWGFFGGYPAQPNRIYIIRRKNGIMEKMDISYGLKLRGVPLEYGDTVVFDTMGGGGWGDPLDRDPEMVKQDLRLGYITEKSAKDAYGVAVDRDSWRVDEEATRLRRKAIKRSRLFLEVEAMNEEFVESMRTVRVNSRFLKSIAKVNTIGETGRPIAELVGKTPPPLRVVLVGAEGFSDNKIALDNTAMRILGVKIGDKVWLRPLEPLPIPKPSVSLIHVSEIDGVQKPL